MNPTSNNPLIEPKLDHAGRKADQVAIAALKLFLDHGFAATSMDAVAKEASVSKATLYGYFPSKEALFETLIVAQCHFLNKQLASPDLSKGLAPALRKFAREYVRIFVEREGMAFVKLIANESGRFPKLALLFYESGPIATTRILARFLEDAEAQQLIICKDAMVAATHFLSLIRGEIPLRAVLGLGEHKRYRVKNEIEAGLSLFLQAYSRA